MRYKLEESQSKPNHWVCSDFENKIVCIFENKRFNDTQELSLLEDFDDYMELATIAREMADWLRENHHNKVL